MKVLIIDNYDSFTYNLYQYIGEILQDQNPRGTRDTSDARDTFQVDVLRNNEITLEEIKDRKYDRIVISPGPGNPSDKAYFGVCGQVLTIISHYVPVLGVCLGMQGMAHYFGGRVVKAKKPMHGKTSKITHNGKGLFTDLPQNLEVMRYHSLIAEKESLPEALEITATSNDSGEIMGLRHKTFPIEGIQFHPESFATEGGKKILENFLIEERRIRRSE